MARLFHAIYLPQVGGNFQACIFPSGDGARSRLGGGFVLHSTFAARFAASSAASGRLLSLSEDDPSPIPSVGFRCSDRMEAETYSKELDVAVRVVQMACSLCQRVQSELVERKRDEIKSKDDDSPVTIAGCALPLSFFSCT